MSLEDFAKELEKVIGSNDKGLKVTRWIDTGYPPLNRIISGKYDGGIPYGRLIEIYGPSSSGKTALATMIMAKAQQMGGVAGFFDHERSFDVDLAVNFGLDNGFPRFIYKQPETWEESNTAMGKIAVAVRKNKMIPDDAPIVFVLDSIASAVPKSVFEKDIDEQTMNDTSALSRVTSTTLRSMAALAAKWDFTVIYLNQVREKIGVLFGPKICCRYDVQIPFTDGTSAMIGEIVKNKINKKVWTYNEESGVMEPAEIVGWFDNGDIRKSGKKWVHIRSNIPETKNGQAAVTVTDDHNILTTRGWVPASQICVGDKLITKYSKKFNGVAEEFICAAIAFDAHIVAPHSTGAVVFEDYNDPQYVEWKMSKLKKHLTFTGYAFVAKTGRYKKFTSNYTSELGILKRVARQPHLLMSNGWTPLQLAIAIMDDGAYNKTGVYTLSIKRFRGNEEVLYAIGESLYRSFGLTYRINFGSGDIRFDTKSSRMIAEIICKYIPPFMERKLPAEHRGKYVEFELNEPAQISETYTSDVVEVREAAIRGGDIKVGMYDIQVSKNDNFIAGNKQNGFIIHNCTPGGKSMGFYASTRLELSRKKVTDASKDLIGQTIGVKAVKNKLTKPFQETELLMTWDENGVGYFDFETSIVDVLIDAKKLPQSGAWIEFEGKKYQKKQLIKTIREEGLMPKMVSLLSD